MIDSEGQLHNQQPAKPANMQQWAEAAMRLSSAVPEATSRVNEMMVTKADVSAEFDSLGLPAYARHIRPLGNFLADGIVMTPDMKTPHVWLQLIPKGGVNKKFTVLDVSPEAVLPKVAQIAQDNLLDTADYAILISEYLDNKYGGQMVVGKDGTISVFFGEGTEQDYSTGSKTPTYTARTGFTGALHYSFDDDTLRKITQQLVSATETASADGRFGIGHHPGYYEFAIGENADGTLRPIFLDYRSSDFYQLQSSSPDIHSLHDS